MKKILCKDEAQFRSWLTNLVKEIKPGKKPTGFQSFKELEDFLSIDLLDAQGRTFEEHWKLARGGQDVFCDWQAVTPIQFRKRKRPLRDAVGLPTSYPCVVVSWVGSAGSRFDAVCHRGLKYVYPSDFQPD